MTDSPKIGIVMQIAEAERELALRRNVYPKLMASGKLKQEQADMNIERQEAIIRTLRFCHKNEGEFHAFVNGRKAEKETSLGPRMRGDDEGEIARKVQNAVSRPLAAKIAGTEFSIESQIEELGLAEQLYRQRSSSVQGYRMTRMIAVQATLQRLKEAM